MQSTDCHVGIVLFYVLRYVQLGFFAYLSHHVQYSSYLGHDMSEKERHLNFNNVEPRAKKMIKTRNKRAQETGAPSKNNKEPELHTHPPLVGTLA